MTTATDERGAIGAANQNFMTMFAAGDAAGMAALYTADGMLLPTNSPEVTGTEAIAAFWQGAMDMGLSSATLETREVEFHGDTGIEVGQYKLGIPDGSVADEGKYIVIWRRTEDGWKLHRDIWNTSRPAA